MNGYSQPSVSMYPANPTPTYTRAGRNKSLSSPHLPLLSSLHTDESTATNPLYRTEKVNRIYNACRLLFHCMSLRSISTRGFGEGFFCFLLQFFLMEVHLSRPQC